MPSMHSNSTFGYKQLQHPATLLSLLRRTAAGGGGGGGGEKRVKSSLRRTGGLLKAFKLFPLLTSGCKMVALLGRTTAGYRKTFIADHATIGTILSHRRGRVTIAIQDDPHAPAPAFVIDLPIYSPAFQREMEGDVLRVAFESATKDVKRNKKLLEEMAWAVYCNGRKIGYSVRRKEMTDEEAHVMGLLKGVSMGTGVLPCRRPEESSEGEMMTYLRARFERVVGSKDSEAMYMINPEGSHDGPELSIFFLRVL